jgi:hypothetical protein
MSRILFIFSILLCLSTSSFADEGGVSFWIPGQIGSFAATQAEPGWSLPITYYHAWQDANASKNIQFGGNITAGLEAATDLIFLTPTYTLKDSYLGAQMALSLTFAAGYSAVEGDVNARFPANTVSHNRTDYASGPTDLYPMVSLKWSKGDLHNFLAYGTFNIPTGGFDGTKLTNMGLGHTSADVGAGYTYFDAKMGQEFSTTLGVTYNFENTHTNYQNGVDMHLDAAASQTWANNFLLGVVGYFYFQLSDDSGSGALISGYRSTVAALGPQAGYFLPVEKKNWFLNLKGYYEFLASDRPEGWNVWLTLAMTF